MKQLFVLAALIFSLTLAGSAAGVTHNMPVSDGSGCVSPTNSNVVYAQHTYFPYSTGYYVAYWPWTGQAVGGYWQPYQLYCEYNSGNGRVVWTVVG